MSCAAVRQPETVMLLARQHGETRIIVSHCFHFQASYCFTLLHRGCSWLRLRGHRQMGGVEIRAALCNCIPLLCTANNSLVTWKAVPWVPCLVQVLHQIVCWGYGTSRNHETMLTVRPMLLTTARCRFTLNSNSRNLSISINNSNLCGKIAHTLQHCKQYVREESRKGCPGLQVALGSDLVLR